MMFPIFNMPCLHNHHQPPVLHSRAPHDGEISSPAATGLAVGLILVALVVAVLVYFWCWRQQEPRNHRREARHRRENQRDQAGQIVAGNGSRAAAPEVQQVAHRRDDAAQGQQECPLPAVPLSIHHHQHDDRHFHGDQYHDHVHEGDHILDCPDNNGRNGQDDSHHGHHSDYRGHHHHRHHHQRHHRFSRSHRTNRLIIPQDPLAEIERFFRPPSPGLPDINRADLEAILNGLDVPLPNGAAQRNANAQEQGDVRRDDESRERRKKRHHHHHHRQRHCHHRQKRVVIH
ncbi:hypothetical protein HDV57DRAFT_2998 [Trichoderma longibrachiatum]